jgi:transposase
LRDYTRLRADLTQERARHYQRLEKLLEDALIKVSSVASKLDGLSVRDMLEALIAGERDPAVLAGLARGKLKAKHGALAEALAGRFDDHHAELARMLLDQIDALGGQIGTLTTRIEELLAAIPAAHGVDPTAPPARVLAAAQTRWCCPRWRGWMRSAASGPAPPRSSSPRSGWTWMSSRLLGIWCRGPS